MEGVVETYKPRNILSITEIMAFMTHHSLHAYKPKGSNAPITKQAAYEKAKKKEVYQKGVVFVSASKQDLSEGKGYVVTSYETLKEKHTSLTHWTPNTYRGGTYYDFKNRIIKGHEKTNLKQINVIGFDIDTKEVDLYALYLGCEELGLPRPNLLLETPRGFQVFFVLKTPFFINRKQDYKALRIAERISGNIRKAISKYVPIDTGCIPFGFYRIPREDNIIDFWDKPANTSSLIAWSANYEKNEQRPLFKVVYSNSTINQVNTEWYQSLIQSRRIDPGYHSASRNNTLLTLAIANYASGRTYEDAYNELDQFNSMLDHPLNKREFERTLKSAYSGKYKGAKRCYVERLLELWTDGKASFQGREGWYKFKKPREERIRSHYTEWESDILSYLAGCTNEEDPFLKGSLRTLAQKFGMALSTLKEVLKRSDRIKKFTEGKGRRAVTKIASRDILLQHLLLARKKRVLHTQQTLKQLIPEIDNYLERVFIPLLEEECFAYELNCVTSKDVHNRTG
ncbi:primase C-terminal domain-containing protein [Heyndrickxia ginsengihumi]|uniref:primase C-terminal domain-containing protein n=1 Tax=Heyndrickxia ginsengihumi TaxID=363870 RepID=UPI003D21A4B0